MTVKDTVLGAMVVIVIFWTWIVAIIDLIGWFFTGQPWLVDWNGLRCLFAVFWPAVSFMLAMMVAGFINPD